MPGVALYRIFNSRSELLYVGVSTDPRKRLISHASLADWYPEIAYASFEWFTGPDLAYACEAAAIERERPRYNVSKGRAGRPPKGTYAPTPPAAALAEWAKGAGLKDDWHLSYALGCAVYVIRQVLGGRRPPSLALAAKIEALTNGAVPASSWAMEAA